MHAGNLAWNPAIAVWEVGRASDLDGTLAARAPGADRHELSTAEALDLVGQLRELAPGVVVLSGGDAPTRPDLDRIVGEAVRQGLRVAMAPSLAPPAERVRRLAALGVGRMALRLDGPDAVTHDRAGGVPGAFAKTLAAIEAVRDAHLRLQVTTTVARQTVAELPRMAELVAEIAPVLWNVHFVVPSGSARSTASLGSDSCERVFHFLDEWSERSGIAVTTTAAPAYRRVVLHREAVRRAAGRPHARAHPLPLNDGKGVVFVSYAGDVQPSGLLPLSTANVRETRLAAAYRRSRFFRALRDVGRLGGRCGACPFRWVCGGSRARAFAATGDFLAEDPSCAYVPPGWRAAPRRPDDGMAADVS
jgi:MoaA/NifB/PqqE/SkfB family radical SAM enzyme